MKSAPFLCALAGCLAICATAHAGVDLDGGNTNRIFTVNAGQAVTLTGPATSGT